MREQSPKRRCLPPETGTQFLSATKATKATPEEMLPVVDKPAILGAVRPPVR
jgi:UTP-glucose-1-phosphate uridylyltransferase